ncbi:MAG: hypothetical protein QM743_07620 [Chitinophagaceae bacterium]
MVHGTFSDAYDPVMVPDVYGMSQFAIGGMMAEKPCIIGSLISNLASESRMRQHDYPDCKFKPDCFVTLYDEPRFSSPS